MFFICFKLDKSYISALIAFSHFVQLEQRVQLVTEVHTVYHIS